MKKTVTVNLNGRVFNIDEDAYERLKQYLEDTETHADPEERERVMQVIEASIAGSFDKKLQGRQVIELADVEEAVDELEQQENDEDTSSSPRVSATYSSEASGFAESTNTLNIDDTVKEETGKEQENCTERSEPERDVEPDSLSKALRIIGIVFAGLVGLLLFFSVFGIIVLLSLNAFGLVPWLDKAPAGVALLVSIAVFLLCPGIVLAIVCTRLGKSAPRKRPGWPFWALLALWAVSIVAMIVSGAKTFQQSHTFVKNSCLFKEQIDKRPFLKQGGTAVSEWRNNGDFHGIDAEDAVTIRYRQSDSCSVQVIASPDAVGGVRTDIRGGVLFIRNENRANEQWQDVEVFVSAPSLDRLKLSEACSFRSEAPVNLNRMDLEIDEASTVVMTGEVSKLKVKAEEAAQADLTGLSVGKAEVRADEASSVSLGQVDDLRIRTSGASTVTYKGQPRRIQRYSSDFTVIGWEE